MNVLEKLKNQGYRLTKPRQELLKTLASYPLTVQEIYDLLKKKNVHIDLASVYRSLNLFETMGIVHIIELGGHMKRYELADTDNHHHHLICNNCGTIGDISLKESGLIKEVNKKSKFKIDHHHLEFFGLCQNCQQYE